MILLYYVLIYRSTVLNICMEIREILTILEGLESGVRVLDQDYDLDQQVLTLSVHG